MMTPAFRSSFSHNDRLLSAWRFRTVTAVAPRMAPGMDPMPPRMIMVSTPMDSRKVKDSGLMKTCFRSRLEVQDRHRGGSQDGTRDGSHAPQDDHGQHPDGFQEGEGLGVDEDLLPISPGGSGPSPRWLPGWHPGWIPCPPG